ncbi:hypothetical protein D3C80_540940 [compost metagenome]
MGRSSNSIWAWMASWTKVTGVGAWPAARSRPAVRTGACKHRRNCSAWLLGSWISVPIAGVRGKPVCVVTISAWRQSRACVITSSSSRCKVWPSGCPKTSPGRACSMPTLIWIYPPAAPKAPSSSMPAVAPCACARKTNGWTFLIRPCVWKAPWRHVGLIRGSIFAVNAWVNWRWSPGLIRLPTTSH